MQNSRRLALIFSLVAALATARAETQEAGFLHRTVVLDGTTYRFQVYLPREYQRSVSLPVILALHGGGQYGTDGISQTDVSLARAIRRYPDRFPAIVVFPQSPPGSIGF